MTEISSIVATSVTRRSTLRAAGAGAALLGLGLSGCRSAATGGAASADASGDAKPVKGGTLTIASQQDFTPALLFTISGACLPQRLIYNTLTVYDKNFDPQPELATKWDVSDDGRTVTLHLREGVTFHDGRAFTADDVVSSIKNTQNPDRSAQLRSTALAITGFDKKGDHELVLTLDHPVSNLFDLFEFMIISDGGNVPDALTGKKFNGTGPFRAKKWTPGTSFTFERNDAYWKDEGPYLDAVEIRVISETDSIASALKTGEVHLTFQLDGKNNKAFSSQPAFTVNQFSYGTGGSYYVGANVTHPELKEKAVRQAISYAVDRDRLVSQVMYGFGTATDTPWTKDSVAFAPSEPVSRKHDPAKARELLKSVGATGLKLTMEYVTGQDAFAQLVQYDLKQVGITVDIVPRDPAAWQKKLIAQDFDALWCGGHGFGQSIPSTLAVSAYPFNAEKNTSKFSSAAYKKLAVGAWNTTADPTGAAARGLYKKLTDLLLDECFVIDLAAVPATAVYTTKLHDIAINRYGLLDLDTAYLAK
ncbi:ABC transporter substrate-binding protein [Streptomyces sp. Q6]|uniref:ABC transporter substrate-binding protein n=1 Tax=Streptomyces citrinus TaxID=3118173 RepID=A0ACD5AKQ6_9ACTN